VGAALSEPDVLSATQILPLKAADKFIVGYVHSIAIRLSKMQDEKSLTLQ
jgi:hypothetical protein